MTWAADHFKMLASRPRRLFSLPGNDHGGDVHAHDGACAGITSTPKTLKNCLGQTPYWQLLNAISAFRLFRVALHHEKSRTYLESISQITPVLVHFGSLVMCFLYFAAVVAMELLAKEPEMREIQSQSASWMQKSPGSLVYVNSCKEKLPNFDCPSSALLTMFMMFTGNSQSLKSTCLSLFSCVRLRSPD